MKDTINRTASFRLPLLMALCAIAVLFSCVKKQKETSAVEKNEAGVTQMNEGNYAAALESFKQAAGQHGLPMDYRGTILRNLALTYNELGNTDSAVHYATLAAKCYTKNSYDYLVNMADVDLMTQKYKSALNRLQKAVKLEPDDMAVNNTLGLFYMGEYDYEYTDLQKALEFNKKAFNLKNDRITEEVLARNYFKLEDWTQAEIHYRQLFEKYPKLSAYPLYLGMAVYKLNNKPDAELYFDAAVKLDSSYTETITDFKLYNR